MYHWTPTLAYAPSKCFGIDFNLCLRKETGRNRDAPATREGTEDGTDGRSAATSAVTSAAIGGTNGGASTPAVGRVRGSWWEEGNNRAVYDVQCSTFFNILQHVELYLVRMILDDDLCSFHAGWIRQPVMMWVGVHFQTTGMIWEPYGHRVQHHQDHITRLPESQQAKAYISCKRMTSANLLMLYIYIHLYESETYRLQIMYNHV